MPRPVLRLKPKRPENALDCPQCDGWLVYKINTDTMECNRCDHKQPVEYDDRGITQIRVPDAQHKYPKSWVKGQLLNVRRNGDTFIITLLNEEFDPSHPERAMHFTNSYECQEFISFWYSRDSHDPRAV